jgi:hypothetical protein
MKKLTITLTLLSLISCSSFNEYEHYKSNLLLLRKQYPTYNVDGYRNFSYIFTISKNKDTTMVSVSRSIMAMPVIDTLAIKVYTFVDYKESNRVKNQNK